MIQEVKQYSYILLDINEEVIETVGRGRYKSENTRRKYANLEDILKELNLNGNWGYEYKAILGENKDMILLQREDVEPGVQMSYLTETINALIEAKRPRTGFLGIPGRNVDNAQYIAALTDLAQQLGLDLGVMENEIAR